MLSTKPTGHAGHGKKKSGIFRHSYLKMKIGLKIFIKKLK